MLVRVLFELFGTKYPLTLVFEWIATGVPNAENLRDIDVMSVMAMERSKWLLPLHVTAIQSSQSNGRRKGIVQFYTSTTLTHRSNENGHAS